MNRMEGGGVVDVVVLLEEAPLLSLADETTLTSSDTVRILTIDEINMFTYNTRGGLSNDDVDVQ